MAVGMTFTGGTRCRDKARRIGHLLLISGLLFGELVGSAYGAGSEESALPDAFRSEDLLWEVRLGTHQYTMPRIDGGRVFIGINDLELKHPAVKRTGGGIVMCMDAANGEMIWQLPIPRYMKGVEPPYHFNQWKCGVCSRPAIDGKYLYIVGPRGDVLCLDRNGQGDGNDGPFCREAEYMGVPSDAGYKLTAQDGDIVWQFDMIKEVAVVPHDVCGSSGLLHGDYFYACTSNGQDDKHKYVANPLAPSLIVLDKRTGRLAATDGELIGKRMFHGHWSSPVATRINERDMILFGAGDGILYAFEPLGLSKAGDELRTLKKIWQHDCNPSDYRSRDGRDIPYANHTNKSPDGPSEIISTPAIHDGRIYICIGQSPIHGPGQGMLSCLDAATGEEIWASKKVDRSIVDVAIAGGLAYIADFTGRLHCFDADTGEHLWQHELDAGVWTASPVVVNGKVYASTENGVLWVLRAGLEKEVISRSRLRSVGITPVVEDGVFYLPTQNRLFALKVR
ncbi:MAG: PQQ-binding-like beta-propeller repeat protein [Sedimentisphaerales bacterium]|nr:PQQ-binding-like beta-propeller repeat protein [Sedimentisphaerales bacterium]